MGIFDTGTIPSTPFYTHMKKNVNAHILVSGVVQGVGFRYFTSRLADQHGLTGWVRNTPAGKVEIVVEGDKGLITSFIKEVQVGPTSGHVTTIDVQWKEYTGTHKDFRVRL